MNMEHSEELKLSSAKVAAATLRAVQSTWCRTRAARAAAAGSRPARMHLPKGHGPAGAAPALPSGAGGHSWTEGDT